MGRKKSSPVKKAVTTTVVKKGDVPPPDDGDVAAAAGPPSSLGGLGRLPLVLAVLAVAAAALGPSLLSSYGGRSIPEAILEPVQEGRREAELDPVPADAASGDTAAQVRPRPRRLRLRYPVAVPARRARAGDAPGVLRRRRGRHQP